WAARSQDISDGKATDVILGSLGLEDQVLFEDGQTILGPWNSFRNRYRQPTTSQRHPEKMMAFKFELGRGIAGSWANIPDYRRRSYNSDAALKFEACIQRKCSTPKLELARHNLVLISL
ncbi:hypothetical protein E4U58_001277, partial [Claviceps cyperi]